jgi:hypothetical protein
MGLIEVEEDNNISVIIQDIARTYPRHLFFMDPLGKGREILFNILVSYSRLNPTVGYCQGMSYIVAILLMHNNEEDAFWSLVSLLSSPNYMLNCKSLPSISFPFFISLFQLHCFSLP